MEVIDLKLHEVMPLKQKYVVAIGFFDGLHLGHQALIHEVMKKAKEEDLIPAVMLFDRHPLTVLKGEKTTHLTSADDRLRLLKEEGIQTVFRIIFTRDVADLTPDAFIEEFLYRINACHVVVGYDFRFGKNNQGTIQDFYNRRFSLSVVDGIMYNDHEKVSSSLIKRLLDEGHIEEANRLLTRPFTIYGKVIHGKARGRTIGFPTANVDYDHYYLPRRGVYGVKVKVSGQEFTGMANIGPNPTFHDIDHDSLEINIFDFKDDIYDDMLAAEFYVFERGEKTFAGADELMHQLHQDQKIVRKMMNERSAIKKRRGRN